MGLIEGMQIRPDQWQNITLRWFLNSHTQSATRPTQNIHFAPSICPITTLPFSVDYLALPIVQQPSISSHPRTGHDQPTVIKLTPCLRWTTTVGRPWWQVSICRRDTVSSGAKLPLVKSQYQTVKAHSLGGGNFGQSPPQQK